MSQHISPDLTRYSDCDCDKPENDGKALLGAVENIDTAYVGEGHTFFALTFGYGRIGTFVGYQQWCQRTRLEGRWILEWEVWTCCSSREGHSMVVAMQGNPYLNYPPQPKLQVARLSTDEIGKKMEMVPPNGQDCPRWWQRRRRRQQQRQRQRRRQRGRPSL